MSVLDRLWRIARAEANIIARKAREMGQRKEGAPEPEDAEPEREAPPPPQGAAPRGHGAAHESPRHTPRQDPVLAAHYAVLKVPYGADLEAVKHAYRQAMRDFHPDHHTGDERRARAATEVAQHLTEAYSALKDHLDS